MTNARVVLIRNAAYHDFGGGERFPVFVAQEVKKQHYSPLIITRSPTLLKFCETEGIEAIRGWWWPRQNWSGWRVVLLPIYIAWQLILFAWYVVVFIRERPKVVHIQSKDDFIAATFAAKMVKARVIWTDHADLKHIWRNLTHPYKNPIGKLVYIAAHFAQAITVVSESEQREVRAHLPSRSLVVHKLSVIYNGCFDQQSCYTSVTKPKVFTFCSLNRLVTDKGIGEMIAAFTVFHQAHPRSQLLLVGDGPERQKFETMADNNAIKFLGYQTDPLRYLASSDVFLQPTYHEGFSVAIIEAAMLAKPIIATDVGGNPEIIKDHITGLLIPAKDSGALLAAMELLYSDVSLRQSIATAARRRYEAEFQFDRIVKERFIPLYENTRR